MQVFPDPGDPDCEPDTPERGGPTHQGPLGLCRCPGSDATPSDALPETGPGPRILPAAGHHPLLSVVSIPLAAFCPHPRFLPLSVSQPPNLDPFAGFPGPTLLSRHTCPCPLAPARLNQSGLRVFLCTDLPASTLNSCLCLHYSSRVNEELLFMLQNSPRVSFPQSSGGSATPPVPCGAGVKNIPAPGMNGCIAYNDSLQKARRLCPLRSARPKD